MALWVDMAQTTLWTEKKRGSTFDIITLEKHAHNAFLEYEKVAAHL